MKEILKDALPLIIIIAILLICLPAYRLGTNHRIDSWAQEHNYEVLKTEYSFGGGPYWYVKNKDVRYVTVRKPDGQIAHYYLLVNQIWFSAQEE